MRGMVVVRVFAIVTCLILIGGAEGVYENNPFLTGNYKPAIAPPSKGDEKPMVVHSTQSPQQVDSIEQLKKYCVGPRGHFQGKYCNTFVDCWEDHVVEFVCPPPLFFSPQGYCDFPERVYCSGKQVKPGVLFQPSNDGSYVPQPAPPVPVVPAYSPSGWPTDGSYRPPPVAAQPPLVQWDDGSYKPGQGGWDDGSYKPQSSTNAPPPAPPVIEQKPTQAPSYPPTNAPPVWVPVQEVTTAAPVVLPQLPSNKYCKKPRGQFPGSACNKYVNCWDNVVVEQECPEGLNFNPYKGYCDYHWNYDCKHSGLEVPTGTVVPPVIPTQPPVVPTQPPVIPTQPPVVPPSTQPPVVSSQPPLIIQEPAVYKFCKTHRGQFPGSACNKYVNCWDGVAIEQECPEGFNFNANKGYCDFPWNYNCGGATGAPAGVPPTVAAPPVSGAPPSESVPAEGSHLLKYCLQPRGQFPGTGCGKYVNCWDGYVVEQECTKGLTFSASKNYCDYGGDPKCAKYEQVGDASADTNEECPIIQGTFRKKNDCTNYYTCIGKKIVAQYACPKGYLYNDVIGVCDLQERVDCSKDPFIYYPTSKTAGLTNLLPPAVIDPSLPCESGTIFRLNENCSHVAICRNGLTEIVQCPQGLNYDVAKDSCLEPHLAKC